MKRMAKVDLFGSDKVRFKEFVAVLICGETVFVKNYKYNPIFSNIWEDMQVFLACWFLFDYVLSASSFISFHS